MPEETQNKYMLYEVEFFPGGKTYSYISDKDSFSKGDIVIVNAGSNNHETTVRIVAKKEFTADSLSFPKEQLKHILRLANEQESHEFARLKKRKENELKKSLEKQKSEITYVSEGIQPDGSFIFSYEDYGVDSFDGMDIETTYILDAENTEKLRLYLSKKYVGSLESMLAQECGQDYRKKAAIELFEEAGVEYKHFSWIS